MPGKKTSRLIVEHAILQGTVLKATKMIWKALSVRGLFPAFNVKNVMVLAAGILKIHKACAWCLTDLPSYVVNVMYAEIQPSSPGNLGLESKAVQFTDQGVAMVALDDDHAFFYRPARAAAAL